MSAQKNVFDSIALVIITSRIFSVFPMKTTIKNGSRKGLICNFSRYWMALFYFSVYTFCLIVANVDEDILSSRKQYDFNKIAYLLYVATVFTEILSTYAIYAMSIYATPNILHLLEKTRQMDILLEKTGYKFRYKAGFFINFAVITSGMYFIILNLSLELWNSPREDMGNYSIFQIVITCWPQFLIHFIESQFVLSNSLFFTRFFAINLILETLFKNNGGEKFLQEPPNFLSEIYNFKKNPTVSDEYVIYCAMKSHYNLFRLTVMNNNVFSVIIMLSSLIQFSTIAFALCFCYYKLDTKPIATIVLLLWALLRSYELVRKVFIVHLVAGEANKCLYYVNKLLMLKWKDKIKNKLDIFVLQLNHCKVKYTACGLFEIDGTLLFTIIAASTMYLIVTYQFQQSLTHRNCLNTNLTTIETF